MSEKSTPSAFYRFRLKWMPFANLAIIGIAIVVLLQLPYARLHILEPAASSNAKTSAVTEVGSTFDLRVYVDNTLGCDYQPSSMRVVAVPADGQAIAIENLEKQDHQWLASDVTLPLGEYRLSASVRAQCEDDPVMADMDIRVVCRPLTIAQAKIQGDVCGKYVDDNCGGYVELPSCLDFGTEDTRIKNPNLNCYATGYYVGQSALSYVKNGETRHYYAALKCGSGNNTECYELVTEAGSCKSSRSPEALEFYGNGEDPVFHKCRIECSR